jgi:Tfp pilus assembly protein PilF
MTIIASIVSTGRLRAILFNVSLITTLSFVMNPMMLMAQIGGGGQQPRPGGSSGAHSLRGKIFLPSGQSPELRMRVVLEISTGGIFGETFSDSVGNFEFRAIANGNYILKVQGDSQKYDAYTDRLEISSSVSRTFTAQVYLRAREADPRNQPTNRILSVADTQEVPKAAKQHYEKALKLAQSNQAKPAIEKLEEAIKVFPDYLYALNKLGEQYLQSGQREQAQAYFERAIATNARFAPPHIGVGTMLNEQKKYAEAVTHLETAVRLDDTYPMVHIQLGLALMETAPPDFVRSEKALLRGLALGGKDVAYVYMHLFNLHIRQRQYVQAAAQLEAFLRDKPDAPEAAQVRQKLESLKKIIAQSANAKP